MRLQRSSFQRGSICGCWRVSAVLLVLMLLVQFRAKATSYDGFFFSHNGQMADVEFRESPDWVSLRIWSDAGVLATEALKAKNDVSTSDLWIHTVDGVGIVPRTAGPLVGQWWEVVPELDSQGQPFSNWSVLLDESGDPNSIFSTDTVVVSLAFRHRVGIHPEDGGPGSLIEAGGIFYAKTYGPDGVNSIDEGKSFPHGEHKDVLVTNRITASVEALTKPGLDEITQWQYQGFAIHVPEPASLASVLGGLILVHARRPRRGR